MRKICVVHLARSRNGPGPLETFLRSYNRFSSGAEHDLLIVFKGSRNESEIAEQRELAIKVGAKHLFIPDFGFDLRAYYLATQRFKYPYFFFLNSFSELLADGWLKTMASVIKREHIGLAGATGSYESMFTNVLIQRRTDTNSSLSRRLWTPVRLMLCRACFDPFPNYHVRTNGFIISRETMLQVWPRLRFTKRGAYLFENGKDSLTNRLARLNLRALVVGRDGRAYEKDEWAKSHTFRHGDQENLLIADNQTRQYASADPSTRRYLSEVTWGE